MTELEFSRPVRVVPLPRDGLTQEIEANPQERAALAALNRLPAIERLRGRFRIAKWRRGVRVEGELSARVTQTCVVSLEPFDSDIETSVDVKFLPFDPDAPAPESPAEDADEDAPDPIIDGRIDLGALASEFLTLALDPYPRKPGVAFEPPQPPSEGDSPFERLRAIGDRDEPD